MNSISSTHPTGKEVTRVNRLSAITKESLMTQKNYEVGDIVMFDLDLRDREGTKLSAPEAGIIGFDYSAIQVDPEYDGHFGIVPLSHPRVENEYLLTPDHILSYAEITDPVYTKIQLTNWISEFITESDPSFDTLAQTLRHFIQLVQNENEPTDVDTH